jgi:membrane associated rhomboid family serine protease
LSSAVCPRCRALVPREAASCEWCGEDLAGHRVVVAGAPLERAMLSVGGFGPALMIPCILATMITAGIHLRLHLRHVGEIGAEQWIDAAVHPSAAALIVGGANLSRAVVDGEPWRLATAVFLHGGLLHLVVNMMTLLDLGRATQALYGPSRSLVLYLLAGLAGSVTRVAWWALGPGGPDPASGGIPSIGASGAILGLAGALVGLGLRVGGKAGRGLWTPLVRSVGLLFVIGFVLDLSGSQIRFDNAAHAGGFLAGAAFGAVVAPGARGRGSPAQVRAWDAAALGLVLLYAAAFVPAGLGIRELVKAGVL